MSFPTKTIQHQGVDVEVSCTKKPERQNEAHGYVFTAKIGDTVYEHGITIGPSEGPFILPTKEDMQKMVDDARTEAAKHCHLRHHIKRLESEII